MAELYRSRFYIDTVARYHRQAKAFMPVVEVVEEIRNRVNHI
jgi:hypothetical protein